MKTKIIGKAKCVVCDKYVDVFCNAKGSTITFGHKDQYRRFCSGGILPVAKSAITYKQKQPYHLGLEDGFEYEDQMPDDVDIAALYKHVDGVALYPFINTISGRQFIRLNSWIITDNEGNRSVTTE